MGVQNNISEIRKRLGYSQEEVANRLGVSRQTYMKMEKEGSQITTVQLEELAGFFGVPISEFYFEVQDIEKFKQMYLYILSKFTICGIPKTKLAKLLYLSDFRHFYEHLESMSGTLYKCKEYGPLADSFLELTDDMFENGEISIDFVGQAQMICLSKSASLNNLDLLSTEEKQEMDEICDSWRDENTQSIVNFTHKQKPWMACRPNEIIPYELILQEEPNHVY